MARKRRKARKSRARAVDADTPAAAPGPSEREHEPDGQQELAPGARPPYRLAVSLFILAFLGYQIAMPLRYYLAGGGYDERFSWRMFSSVRMQSCKASVEDVHEAGDAPRTRDVNLPRELHVAWIRMLERGRPAVVDKLLQHRCGQEGVGGARYLLRCADPDGTQLPEQKVEIDCRSGRLTRSGGSS
jgi:hypothetical protein